MQEEIESLQKVTLLSSEFDYRAMLAKYNISEIDNSVIKYYRAVQKWTSELIEKLDFYEKEKESVINEFGDMGRKLVESFKKTDELDEKENNLLYERCCYFADRFSVDMSAAKSKILSVKHQADRLEKRIDKVDCADDSIYQLALIEKEERAGFEFIAENTAKIVRNALRRVELLETNRQYAEWIVDTLKKRTMNYNSFRTSGYEELKESCEKYEIDEKLFLKWYGEWQKIRFSVEEKIQDVMDRELEKRIVMVNEDEISVAQQIIAELELYINNIDRFYREERREVYQNCALQPDSDTLDMSETKKRLSEIKSKLNTALQNIIGNCADSEDKVFILNLFGNF